MVFNANTTRRIQRPRPVQLFGEPIQWAETAWYLAITLDTWLTWSVNINQVGRKAFERLGVLGPLLNKSVHQKQCVALQAAHLSHDGLCMPDLEACCPHPH
jgi:hypothetical protein